MTKFLFHDKIPRMRVPQPFPYQGSKRGLASLILRYFPKDTETLWEPFAGSAAISIAAAAARKAHHFVLNDLNAPLARLWERIINDPKGLASDYERIWKEQELVGFDHFAMIRDQFNRSGEPAQFLYLLARCVKAAVRRETQNCNRKETKGSYRSHSGP